MTALHDLLVALDIETDEELGGPPKQTLSQSVGLYLLARARWAKPCSWILTLVMNERHHAVRNLYGDDGAPIFPKRMPAGAPGQNPYPVLTRLY